MSKKIKWNWWRRIQSLFFHSTCHRIEMLKYKVNLRWQCARGISHTYKNNTAWHESSMWRKECTEVQRHWHTLVMNARRGKYSYLVSATGIRTKHYSIRKSISKSLTRPLITQRQQFNICTCAWIQTQRQEHAMPCKRWNCRQANNNKPPHLWGWLNFTSYCTIQSRSVTFKGVENVQLTAECVAGRSVVNARSSATVSFAKGEGDIRHVPTQKNCITKNSTNKRKNTNLPLYLWCFDEIQRENGEPESGNVSWKKMLAKHCKIHENCRNPSRFNDMNLQLPVCTRARTATRTRTTSPWSKSWKCFAIICPDLAEKEKMNAECLN